MNKYLERAKGVLHKNWRGSYTVPSGTLYPHQWSWDSAFIARGYAHYDQEKAETELLNLFKGQWKNGMLPHIIFRPGEEGYFPGPEIWNTDISPHAPEGIATSGITQPPIHAIMAYSIYEISQDKEESLRFLKEIFPGLVNFHRYLYRERDPYGEGLVYIRHPWESGMDNSPVWDIPLQEIEIPEGAIPSYKRRDLEHVPLSERPGNREYDKYLYLLQIFKDCRYEEARIFEECPFIIQGNLFNAILHQSNKALYNIADLLHEDKREILSWIDMTEKAFNHKLWDGEDGFYYVFDMKNNRPIKACTAAGFVPLFGGLPDIKQARILVDTLDTECFCKMDSECYAIPNYNTCAEDFSPQNYWRGPIWININWLIYEGLKGYGYMEYASLVRNSIIKLVQKSGFYEYFDPFTGKGHGTKDFSWTAALFLDVILQEGNRS